jgi:citrate lyase subunit beta/citryl-CoA lyase
VRLRSLLFVPGDRPERIEKAQALNADALILDLEDAVAADARPKAREAIVEFLKGSDRKTKLLVRVNPLDSIDIDLDLTAIAPGKPDGVVLPKAEGSATVQTLADRMASHGMFAPILPIATETSAAIFQLGSYHNVAHRLCGLTWGAEDLPAAIGATTSREADGCYTPPYELARSLTLFGAHAAGVPAIETVFPAFHDSEGLARYAARASRDGFTGMMAIHPAQIEAINAAFTPSEEAIAYARAIVAAFEANPGAGALQLDGKMIDAPHLKQARRTLSNRGRLSEG